MIGLYKAARDFRPDRQSSFRAFAELCITRQVITAIKTATRQKHQPLNQYVSISSVRGSDDPGERSVEALLDGQPFVQFHPASRWRFKCWSAEKNAELIDRLAAEGRRIVVTGAPDETPFIAEILGKAKSKPLNLAGKLTLKQLGAVAARAQLFVGVDSMPLHLAAAIGVPTVALFGPSGETEWGPWNTAYRVVSSTHSGRPCGQDGCGGGKVSECVTLLPVDAVHAAARELLGEAPVRLAR